MTVSTDDDSDGILGTVFIIVVGVAVLGGGFYFYQTEQDATEDAVEIEGTIVETEIEETVSAERGSEDAYKPEIRYEYTYEGERYASSNFCPGVGESCDAIGSLSDRSDAESFLSDYPEGERITVYVPADEPSDAYLEGGDSGASKGALALLAFGGVVLLLGLYDIGYKLWN